MQAGLSGIVVDFALSPSSIESILWDDFYTREHVLIMSLIDLGSFDPLLPSPLSALINNIKFTQSSLPRLHFGEPPPSSLSVHHIYLSGV